MLACLGVLHLGSVTARGHAAAIIRWARGARGACGWPAPGILEPDDADDSVVPAGAAQGPPSDGSQRSMKDIRTKRVYESPATSDGARVLVDRLWPRGLTKEQVQADLWLKEVAPSTSLRKWFHHDRERWDDFKRRYVAELDERPELVAQLRELARKRRLTLLFSARDVERNHAIVLRDYLQAPSKKRAG
jgi:uncharacterized protein YeaO (DUF488 family)